MTWCHSSLAELSSFPFCLSKACKPRFPYITISGFPDSGTGPPQQSFSPAEAPGLLICSPITHVSFPLVLQALAHHCIQSGFLGLSVALTYQTRRKIKLFGRGLPRRLPAGMGVVSFFRVAVCPPDPSPGSWVVSRAP